MTFLTLHVLSHLTLWEKLEVFSIAAGVSRVGDRPHRLASRTGSVHDDLVTFSLLYGSLLVGLPLMIAVLIHRCRASAGVLDAQ